MALVANKQLPRFKNRVVSLTSYYMDHSAARMVDAGIWATDSGEEHLRSAGLEFGLEIHTKLYQQPHSSSFLFAMVLLIQLTLLASDFYFPRSNPVGSVYTRALDKYFNIPEAQPWIQD